MASWQMNQPRLHLNSHPGTDPERFTTKIRSIEEGGLVLEESFCYPRGGGQPGDVGLFDYAGKSYNFTEVTAQNVIFHPVNSPNEFEAGEELTCSIDRDHRNSLARTHTAQHVVSAMADELWGATTVGNQLGTTESRIDLKFEDKEAFNVENIETAVNQILGTSIPVTTHNWNLDEIMTDDRVRNRSFVSKILERLPDGIDTMRVVQIAGIDICPCAGSHVSNTIELQPIKVTRVKQKGAGKLRLYYEL